MKKIDLSNIDIVLYILDNLGGAIKKVPTEDIALECFKLIPSRFSWVLHPRHPDMEPVRKALFAARSEVGGALVAGRHGKTKENQVSDGWIFTPNGIHWIEKNKDRIELLLGSKQKAVKRTQIDKKIFEFKNSTAFKKFLNDKTCENIHGYEFTYFLNANLDTPSAILRDRIDKIRAIASKAKEDEIVEFINKAETHFSNLLKL